MFVVIVPILRYHLIKYSTEEAAALINNFETIPCDLQILTVDEEFAFSVRIEFVAVQKRQLAEAAINHIQSSTLHQLTEIVQWIVSIRSKYDFKPISGSLKV